MPVSQFLGNCSAAKGPVPTINKLQIDAHLLVELNL